jgi:hypothetical protein
MGHRRTTTAVSIAVIATAMLVWSARTAAHDIPADVTVQALVKPAGQTLSVLVRVPLGAMRDVNFPTSGPGFLILSEAGPFLRDAATIWIAQGLTVYAGDVRLAEPELVAVRVSRPSDRSFATWDQARAYVTGDPLPDGTDLIWNQALLDVLLEYPIASDTAEFSIRPEFARLGLRVLTVLRFLPPGGAVRAFEYRGDPGLVRLDPRWHQAALGFVRLGFRHILDGIDHLLFLACLVIPFRRLKALVIIITSFTVAHSITLLGSAFDLAPDRLWFPPLVETLIAASIVYMALENIVGTTSIRRRWMITFGFGLVHGFGFSFALRESLQFAGSHLLTSLLAFNVGVELGQLAALIVLVPIVIFVFRWVMAERIGTIILSALIAHTAWHWMEARGAGLSAYDWSGPGLGTMALIVRVLMIAVVVASIVWGVRAWQTRERPG